MKAKKHWAEWTDDDTYPVPVRIFQAGDLRIDEVLRERMASAKAPVVQSHLRPFAMQIGRRALEVAIRAAVIGSEQAEAQEAIWQWEQAATHTREAARYIRRFLETLGEPGPAANHNLLRYKIDRVSGQPIPDLLRSAQREHAVLREAAALLAEISSDARRRHRTFAAARQNPGAPDRREFLFKLAEAWTFVMGRRPGASELIEKNPFLRMAEAGWRDWKMSEPESELFGGVIRQVLKRIDPVTERRLISEGPTWMTRGLDWR